jgi:hypothetical protein
LRTDQHVALMFERDFAHGANQQGQELVAYHGVVIPRPFGPVVLSLNSKSARIRNLGYYQGNVIAGEAKFS